MALGFALGGREAVGGRVPKQIGQDDRLGLGADEDGSLLAMMLGLVRPGPELPDFAAAVDVGRPDLADFAGPAAGEALEANHIGDDLGQGGERGVHHHVGHGENRRRLAGGGATLFQSSDRAKVVVDLGRHQLFGGTPLEALPDDRHQLVDVNSGLTGIDQHLPDGLELLRAEVGGGGPPVGSAEVRVERKVDRVKPIAGRPVLPAVVFFAVFVVGVGQFHDGEAA